MLLDPWERFSYASLDNFRTFRYPRNSARNYTLEGAVVMSNKEVGQLLADSYPDIDYDKILKSVRDKIDKEHRTLRPYYIKDKKRCNLKFSFADYLDVLSRELTLMRIKELIDIKYKRKK